MHTCVEPKINRKPRKAVNREGCISESLEVEQPARYIGRGKSALDSLYVIAALMIDQMEV